MKYTTSKNNYMMMMMMMMRMMIRRRRILTVTKNFKVVITQINRTNLDVNMQQFSLTSN